MPHFLKIKNYGFFGLLLLFITAIFLCKPLVYGAYQQALPGYQYHFPQDHAAHPGYKTEWWYYTGHLKTPTGKTYGFELTFFRNGTGLGHAPNSPAAASNLYLTHYAISDESGKRFYYAEKLNRPGLGLADARTDIYSVYNELWSVAQLGDAQVLKADSPTYSINLLLQPAKPLVLNGENGVSQKADCRGCASHYYSFTRLNVSGQLLINNKAMPVTGLAWMDHEYGTNQLTTKQKGWDWFSIQLNDKTEVMLYLMRNKDGSFDKHSSGTLVDALGHSRHLTLNDFKIQAQSHWHSPKTGAQYPMDWTVHVIPENITLSITPALRDQELVFTKTGRVNYWEGSAHIKGTHQAKPVQGVGYVEMTGYDRTFKQKI